MLAKIKELLGDVKLEILAVICYVGVYGMKQLRPNIFPVGFVLASYFTQDRLNGIAALFAITIGVYIAVITVLATSEIGISKKMLERKLDEPLINIIVLGMVENFIAIALAVFIPINKATKHILMLFLIVSIISFAKFIVLLVIIFKGNMAHMAKAIDETTEYNDRLLTYIEGIYKHLQKQER